MQRSVRRRATTSALTALALGAATLTGTSAASAVPAASAGVATSSATATLTRSVGQPSSYLVLGKDGVAISRLVAAVTRAGGTVRSRNAAVGLLTVRSTRVGFAGTLRRSPLVEGVASDVVIGHAPHDTHAAPRASVEKEARAVGAHARTSRPAVRQNVRPRPGPASTSTPDPLDSRLWGMAMIHAGEAHALQAGDRRVLVGDIDTGMDASEPDIAANFDASLSRNFTTDIPVDSNGVTLDGPCEYPGCKDPADVDGAEHGTHTAGTIAAAANGVGVTGVAPNVSLVNLRAGQDSGYFFLQPTVDALTYAADNGIDVVNMSFYVDPWLYNCAANAADTPAEQAEQKLIVKAMNKALKYAYHHNVTLVSAAGNENTDLTAPLPDSSSPDYPQANEATGVDPTRTRSIDPATCVSEPTQGPNVIGVSAIGPSGRKSDFSNWGLGQIDVAAPGGWYRDGFGTPSYRTNQNLILSTYPVGALQEEGSVDETGAITPVGLANGVLEDCPAGVTDYHHCGWYGWLQGTSMASPHAAGVAALIVSEYGKGSTQADFTMRPKEVARILLGTATDTPCPVPATVDYLEEGRDASYTATCAGDAHHNGFYGYGVVDAQAAVSLGAAHVRP